MTSPDNTISRQMTKTTKDAASLPNESEYIISFLEVPKPLLREVRGRKIYPRAEVSTP